MSQKPDKKKERDFLKKRPLDILVIMVIMVKNGG